MTTIAIQRFTEPMIAVWQRKLSWFESAYVALVLLMAFTAYRYVLLLPALLALGRPPLPLGQCLLCAAIEIIPAFMAFEFSKRILAGGLDARALAAIGGALLFAAVLSTLMELVYYSSSFNLTPSWRMLIVDRMPGTTLTAIAITWANRRSFIAGTKPDPSASAEGMVLPPPEWIDWAQAVGNYVEVHARERTILLRMTLKQLSTALPSDRFVRIHRSALINCEHIAKVDRLHKPRHVQLANGQWLKIGDAYRTAFEQLFHHLIPKQ